VLNTHDVTAGSNEFGQAGPRVKEPYEFDGFNPERVLSPQVVDVGANKVISIGLGVSWSCLVLEPYGDGDNVVKCWGMHPPPSQRGTCRRAPCLSGSVRHGVGTLEMEDS
jgi:hypothetical protein